MSASVFVLRPLAEVDLPAILDLWVAAWGKTSFEIDFAARRGWFKERLRGLAANGAAIIVGLDTQGAPAGFLTIAPGTGELDQLCVAPREQGSGLASALLSEAKRRSPGAVALDVNEANGRARRFYEREEFVVVGRGASSQSGLATLRMRWERRNGRARVGASQGRTEG